ncbi:MAG: hypothetical protein WCQ50_08545 [Spirochaetota bacterium]
MKASLGKFAIAVAVVAAMVLAACQQPMTTTSTPVSTIYGSLKGQVTNEVGTALAGVVVTYSSPTVVSTSDTKLESSAKSRAIKTVTTDANGYYEIDGFVTGSYNIQYAPPVSSSSVNNMYKQDTFTVMTPAQFLPILAGNSTTAGEASIGSLSTKGTSGYYSQTSNVVLPTLGGTIKGKIVQVTSGSTYNSTATVVASKGIAMPLTNGYLYPTYSSTTSAVTYANAIATTTDSAGLFSFANVPLYFYGTSSTSDIARQIKVLNGDGTATVDGTQVSTPDGSAALSNEYFASLPALDLSNRGAASKVLDLSGTPIVVTAIIAPTIIAQTPAAIAGGFAPLTTATATVASAIVPLTFTFSKAMDSTVGTVAVTGAPSSSTYVVTLAWDTDKKILTVTPSAAFKKGDTLTASYSSFKSQDGALLTNASKTFTVMNGITLVSSNVLDSYLKLTPGIATVTVTSTIDFTFNIDVASSSAVTLTQNSVDVPFTVATAAATTGGTDKKVLRITPVASLLNNKPYVVNATVSSGVTGDSAVTIANATFTTVAASTLSTPVVSLNSTAKAIASSRSTYNSGDSTVYLTWPAITGADQYKVNYRVVGTPTWTAGTTAADSNSTVVSGNWYYGLTTSSLVSGQSIEVQVIASNSNGYGPDSAASTVVSVSDTTAPISTTLAASTVTASSGTTNNSAGTVVSYATKSFTLPSSAEKMGMPAVSTGGTLTSTIGTVSISLDSTEKIATVLVTVAAGQDASGKTVIFTVADAAGNAWVTSSTLATQFVTF